MTYKEFKREYAYWLFISMIVSKKAVFKYIEGFSFATSLMIYLGLFVGMFLLGLILYRDRNRNMTNILYSAVLPLGIYTVISYWNYFTTRIIVLLSISAVLITLLAIRTFGRQIKRREYYWQIVHRRIFNFVHGAKTISAILLSILVLPILSGALLGEPIYKSSVESVNGIEENEYTIANNIGTVSKLEEDVWSTLDMNERLDVLQTVANIEANYLGLSTELRVTADNLSEFILGQYNDSCNQIIINMEHLKNSSAHEVLNTLCHEAYHGYERRLTDLYSRLTPEERELRLFNDAASYDKEFADYKRDEGYFSQKVEKDSRAYAKDAVNDYYAKIDKYLNKESKDENAETIEMSNDAIKEAFGL